MLKFIQIHQKRKLSKTVNRHQRLVFNFITVITAFPRYKLYYMYCNYLIGLAVGVLSEQTRLLELVGELVHALLVLLCPVLQHFAHTANKRIDVY